MTYPRIGLLLFTALLVCTAHAQHVAERAAVRPIDRVRTSTAINRDMARQMDIIGASAVILERDTASTTVPALPNETEPTAESALPRSAPSIDLHALKLQIPEIGKASVVSNNTIKQIPDSTSSFEVFPGKMVTVQNNAPVAQTVVGQQTTTASSTVLFTLDDQNRIRTLGLVHKTAGLYWQRDKQNFIGELLIGVIDRENVQATGPLSINVPVQLLAKSGSLERKELKIDHIGSPLVSVAIQTDNPDDPFKIQLVSQVDANLPPAELVVNRPRLTLSAPSSIQGWGVEVARVTLRGSNTELQPGNTISLELDRPGLLESTSQVQADGTATMRLRSSGLGNATLSIMPGVYSAEPKIIRFVLPWAFGISTLIGASLGALVFALRRRTSKMKYWIIGLLIGSVGTVMAYVGLRLPVWIPVPEHLVGEAVPFALAFLCALSPLAFTKS